jgi:hypothetical protein
VCLKPKALWDHWKHTEERRRAKKEREKEREREKTGL